MWRIANGVYRAFRNAATHYHSQDILVPISTVCNTDDKSNLKQEKNSSVVKKCEVYPVTGNNQFSSLNIEKLQDYLKKCAIHWLNKISKVVKVTEDITRDDVAQDALQSISSLSNANEEQHDRKLDVDQTYLATVKYLSDLHRETMSIFNLQIAIEALESNDKQCGIEILKTLAETGTNAAALYNLGVCYEHGIGVEQDRAKACDYYRQASLLGHVNAQLNLTSLSNHIETDEDEDDASQSQLKNKFPTSSFNFSIDSSISNSTSEDHSFNDNQINTNNKTLACLY